MPSSARAIAHLANTLRASLHVARRAAIGTRPACSPPSVAPKPTGNTTDRRGKSDERFARQECTPGPERTAQHAVGTTSAENLPEYPQRPGGRPPLLHPTLYRRRCAAQPRVGEPAAHDSGSAGVARKREAVSRATRGSLSTTPSCPARSWRNKRTNARVTPGVAGTENCPPLLLVTTGQQGTVLRDVRHL